MFEGMPRLVNMMERAHLQPDMSCLICPAGDVPVCFIQKPQGRTQGVIGVTTALRRWSVVGVPSLIAHRCCYFMYGAVNFLDGVIPCADKSRPGIHLQQLARLPQVG